MAYDTRRNSPAPERRAIVRRRWAPAMMAIAMAWPLALAVALTAAGHDADVGLILMATLNAFPALGMSPFARELIGTRTSLQSYDDFEQAALATATARAYGSMLLLLLVLTLAGAWAGANGVAVSPGPRLWLFWGITMLTLFGTLPAFLAELAIPLSARRHTHEHARL